MARSSRKRGYRIFIGIILIIIAGVIAIGSSVLLTFLGNVFIAIGLHPETIKGAEISAPLLGIMIGSAWLAVRMKRMPWLAGIGASAFVILTWIGAWCYLVGRGNPVIWWNEAQRELTPVYFISWGWAIGAGLIGSIIGWSLRKKPLKLWFTLLTVVILALAGSMVYQYRYILKVDGSQVKVQQLAVGVTAQTEPSSKDGTTVHFLTFDLKQNPTLKMRLYDVDSDDFTPGDDSTLVWLGRSVESALGRLRKRSAEQGRDVLCIFNAGFFNLGTETGHVGSHVAPIAVDGKVYYNVWPVEKPGWTFGIRNSSNRQYFDVIKGISSRRIERNFDIAIAHVRPLRLDGRSVPLQGDLGVTDLKCSRTSIGWSNDSSKFYLLIVRDPDGEKAGVQQMERKQSQTGGWNVADVQEFWEQKKVPNAVLLDGGDSTQVAYRVPFGKYTTAGSGYLLSMTVGYWNERPLRFFVPMLPSQQSRNGVMNYLYIEG